MEQRGDKQNAQPVEAQQRLPWVTPVVQKIDAGDAEINTRDTLSDGAFTTS